MRYQIETEINASREQVLKCFLNVDNVKKWQPSLVTYEQVGDVEPLTVGAKSKQLHKMGNRAVEMIETITVRNDPEEYCATYEADDVWNLIENRFTEEDGRTKWVLTSDFRSTSWMMKIFMLFFPGMFKKQTREFMGYFKEFVESSS